MRRSIGKLLALMAFSALAQPSLKSDTYIISNPYAGIIGPNYIGGSRSFASGSPYYFPRKHTVETYRSQQRKAKQRKKQH